MNNPCPSQPACNKNILNPKSESLQITIQANGEVWIPWIPLEFQSLVQDLLSKEEQAQQIFGPTLCG